MEDEKPPLSAPMQTWRFEDAPMLYRQQINEIKSVEERAEFKWVTWLPSPDHLKLWWGDTSKAAPPGTVCHNLRAGVNIFVSQIMGGYVAFTTDNDEDREIAAGG